MDAPPEVFRLVDRFGQNIDVYRKQQYKETQVRVEFIDPFFEALGWDVRNVSGYAEQYKDVIHEDALTVGSELRAPDYSFRIGGNRKFFLEAKKPSVDLKKNIGPAYQLRRYAWSAKLPLSILTDFEEFAVYDCRKRPKPDDKANFARIMYFSFEDYIPRFDEIYNVFGKESVLMGSFDRYSQDVGLKRGTGEVDVEFLHEIEVWREEFAHNIALRNLDLSVQELNYCVQQTIDRIIFLRMAEDRGIENYGQLRAITTSDNHYKQLVNLFKRADEKYNAGIFDFISDTITPFLEIDDKVLKPIILSLYYPQSPYQFSVLPSDVLGQVYEQFLGKLIRLTPTHRAVVEEKPQARKAGGIYYTPTYIVKYIVDETVGKLIRGKSPRQISHFRVLDPSCGSGSFLLETYQYLLDYHLRYYDTEGVAKFASRKKPPIYQGRNGDWRLTTSEKKRILLNNIFGVDLDRQAVEVTKLSLLLKVLEGETEETLGQQLKLWQERALPDLGNNIKCGNSLIGPDYTDQRLTIEDDELRQINPFDWNKEFETVFEAGGFNIIVGNPPYLFITQLDKVEKEYFQETFTTYSYRYDVYGLFIEKSIKSLLKKDGLLGFIIPHTILNNDSFENLRIFLLENTSLQSMIDLGPGVFQSASNETMLLFIENREPTSKHKCKVIKSDKNLSDLESANHIHQSWYQEAPGFPLLIIQTDEISLLSIINECETKLGDYCTINQGLRTGDNERFIVKKKRLASHKKVVGGKNIARYWINNYNYVQYEPRKLDAPRKKEIFTSPEKIIIQEVRNITLARRLIATYDDDQLYCLQTTNVINLKPDYQSQISLKYLLALINSSLLNWFFRISFPSNNHIASNQLARLPIRVIDNEKDEDISVHNKLVSLVEKILDLNIKMDSASIPREKEMFNR